MASNEDRAPAPRARRRLWRKLLSLLAFGLLFASALVVSFILHLNTRAGRMALTHVVNRALSPVFEGSLAVESIDQLDLSGVRLSRVLVVDPNAERVLQLRDVRVQLEPDKLLAGYLNTEEGVHTYVFPHLRAEEAEVLLLGDAESGVSLARALTPKPSASKPKGKSEIGNPVHLSFPNIELGRVQGSFDLPVLERLLPRLVGVRGSLLVTPDEVAVDVERFGMVVAGMPVNVRGTGAVKVRVPGAIEVQFSGYVGQSEAQVSFKLEGDDTIDITLVAPRVAAETVRAFVPQWPLSSPTAVQAHANGTLPFLDIDLEASVIDAPTQVAVPLLDRTTSFSTEAQLDLSTGIDLVLVSRLSHLSLAQLDPALPESDIHALVTTQLGYHDDVFTQHSDGYVPATLLYDQLLPELAFEATTEGPLTVLEVEIDEPGAPGTVTVEYLSTGELDATVAIPKLTLHEQRRIPGQLSGQASVDAKLKLRGNQLVLDGNVAVYNLRTGDVHVEYATVQARSEQTRENPTSQPVNFNLLARNARVSNVPLQNVSARGNVTLERLRAEVSVSDPQTGTATANAEYAFGTKLLRNISASVERSGVRAVVKAPLLDVSTPRLELTSLEVTRPGCAGSDECLRLTASGSYSPDRVQATISAHAVHLERLWPLVGQHYPVYGKFDANVYFDSAPNADSRLELHGKDVSFQGYGKGRLDALLELTDTKLTGHVEATNSLGITVAVDTESTLHGSPLLPQTWNELTGSASVRGTIDQLATIEPMFQQPWLEALSGQAQFLATVARANPREPPAFAAELRVESLDLQAKPSPTSEPLTFEHHYLYANATFDADTGMLYGSALLSDPTGPLLRIKNATVPLPDFTSDDVMTRPGLLVNVSLEPRDVQRLPYLNRTPLVGSVGAEVTLYGTLEEPEVKLLVLGDKLNVPGLRPTSPVNLAGMAHYRLANHELAVDLAAATDRKTVLLATLDGILNPNEPYQGTARVMLDDLPLPLITVVSDMDVDGHVTGLFELAPQPTPHARLTLSFRDLSSGRALIGDGKLEGDVGPGRFNAQFSVTNIEHSVLLSLDALSSPEHLPTLNNVEQVRALVRTRQMNAATLSPLLKGLLARLGGNLDSDVSLEWQKTTTDEGDVWSNRVSGVAHLRNGRAYVDALGLELQDITADAVATPLEGKTHLALDRIQAKARSRQVNVQGRGQLMFDGARVVSGSTNIVLQDVPLTLEGVNLGKASGAASAELKRMDNWPDAPYQGQPYMLVNATLADFRLRAARSASRSLIDTSDNPEIDVLQTKPVIQDDDVLPYRVFVDLGRDAQFSLAELDIPLSGVTQIDYTNESVLSGTIVLKAGGRIPLLGRLFEVQEGNLRLNPEEPSNPYIDVSLTGRSKDGDPLDVKLTGTLEEPIVTPTLARLQELLGGGAASALSGGFQALGLASMLGDSVQLRVGSDAADENLARYSAAVEVRENLWFEVNYQRNDTAGFQTKNEGAISGTLDYRLNDNWSLRTEAGTAGGSVDVVWQYRY